MQYYVLDRSFYLYYITILLQYYIFLTNQLYYYYYYTMGGVGKWIGGGGGGGGGGRWGAGPPSLFLTPLKNNSHSNIVRRSPLTFHIMNIIVLSMILNDFSTVVPLSSSGCKNIYNNKL